MTITPLKCGQSPCPFLRKLGFEMKRSLRPELAQRLDCLEDARFKQFYRSLEGLRSTEKLSVLNAAFHLHNNDFKLLFSLAFELKKTGMKDEAEKLFKLIPGELMTIPSQLAGLVIGHEGANVKTITQKTGVRLIVGDDGIINIYSSDLKAIEAAKKMIIEFTTVAEVGNIYNATVKGIGDLGITVEIAPGKKGFLPYSSSLREKDPGLLYSAGEGIVVKLIKTDDFGGMLFSEKAAKRELAKVATS